MPDNVEAIALRLRDFIQAAHKNASSRIPMGGIRVQQRTGRSNDRPKEVILATYEACLGKLTPDELAKLNSMIEKMSSVLGSPFGAIIPA